MAERRSAWLLAAAVASFGLSALLVATTFVGTSAYEYFGAPVSLVAAVAALALIT